MRLHLAIVVAAVCLAVVIGAAAYGAGKGSDVPEVVRAQRFEVVDGEGRLRAYIDASEKGAARLQLLSQDGQPGASLAVLPEGVSVLNLNDSAGRPRLLASIGPDDTVMLVVVDEHGNPTWTGTK